MLKTHSKAAGVLAIAAVFAIAFVAMTAFVPTAEAQSSAFFAVNLKQGSVGTDVLNLQRVLNMNSATQISTSGAGAPGQETTYFGAKTRTAVIKFQNLYYSEILAPSGLSSGTGFVGVSTRAKLNSMSGVSTGSTVPGCTSTSGYSPTTGQNCASGGVTTIPSVGGALNVGAGIQPNNALAVQSANRVPFTRIMLTAGSNSVTVNSVTVERVGPAIDSVFTGVVLLDENGTQIGIAKTLNSNHQVSVGDPITIPAGSSRTFTVAGNMGTSLSLQAGQVVGLNVVAVNTNGSVSGSLPVSGAMHTINSNLLIGTATLTVSSFDPNSTTNNKEIGTSAYKAAGIRIQAGAAEQVRLRSVRWNQTGSAGPSDLANVTTYVDGVAYPTSVDSTGKYYTTVFGSGIVLDKGLSKDVYVQVDIVGSSASGRTVQFDIYKNTDVYVTGETYGYGITATPSGNTASVATSASQFLTSDGLTTGTALTPFFSGSLISVTAGSITTISKASSISAQSIAVNVPNQILGGYEVDLKGEAISVQNHTFFITSSVAASGVLLTSVSLYGPNGNVVAGPKDAEVVAGTNQKVVFSDTVTYPIGKGTYTLKGRVPTAAANGTTYIASTTPSSDWTNVTGQSTGNNITMTGLSLIAMNTVTVKAASLAVSVSPSPSAQTITSGTAKTLANYQLDATQSGEDIRFSSLALSLALAGSPTASAASVTGCQIYDGANALNTGGNVPTVAGGANTFSFDNSMTVTKGTVKTLTLKCNLSNVVNGNTFAFGILAGANPSVTGVTSGNDVSETIVASTGQTQTVGAGSLTVTKDSSSPAYTVAAGGQTGVTLGVLRFRAANEAINLDRVGLQLSSTASSSPASLTQVGLYDGGSLVGTATFTGNSYFATSTFFSPVLIPKDTDKLITIKGDLGSIGSGQATSSSGALILVNFDGDDTTATKGTGVDSGATFSTGASTDTVMDGVRAMKSYPTVAKESVGIANNKLNNGTGPLLRFRVTANSAGDVGLFKFTLRFATTVASVTSFNIFGYTDSSYSLPISGVTSGGQLRSADVAPGTTGNQVGFVITNSAGVSTPIQIPAGATRYFEVRGTVTGSATGASVSTQLEGDAAYPSLAQGLASLMAGTATIDTTDVTGAVNDDFIWSPNSTTTSGITANDWTNGFGLPGLPATNLSSEVLSF